MQLQLQFARRVRCSFSLRRHIRQFGSGDRNKVESLSAQTFEGDGSEEFPVEDTLEAEEISEEENSTEAISETEAAPEVEAALEEEPIKEEKSSFSPFPKNTVKGKYAIYEKRLVRVVEIPSTENAHRGILNLQEEQVSTPIRVQPGLLNNVILRKASRKGTPSRKSKKRKVRVDSDDPWLRFGGRAQRLISRCNIFTEKLDTLISQALELPKSGMTLSPKAQQVQQEASINSTIQDAFANERKFFEDLYRDYFLVDIPNSTVVPESGDPEYYFVIQLKLLLGDMFPEDTSHCSEVRMKAQMLKESLRKLANANEMKNTRDAKEEEWNTLKRRFQVLYEDHEELNKSCRALVEDYENLKTETSPDSPRNEFQKGDEVRYWVPAMKKWVSATVEEVVSGDSSNEQKRGKIKLTYEREENPSDDSESKKMKIATKWVSKWHSNLQPLPNKRETYRPPTTLETEAIQLCSYFQSVKYDIPIEAPLRLPKFYHEIDDVAYPMHLYEEPGRLAIPTTGSKYHLMQQYYLNQYLPASHPARLRYAERNGRDPYQDAFIQRAGDSSRIMNSEIRFDYYDKNQHLLGADQPMLNFWYLAQYKRYDKFRIAIHKAQVDYGKHKENYEMRIFRKYAYNFKITSNRTMDMFNARGFDMKYATKRIL